MSENGYNEWYLFGSAEKCCEKWYPERTGEDCTSLKNSLDASSNYLFRMKTVQILVDQ